MSEWRRRQLVGSPQDGGQGGRIGGQGLQLVPGHGPAGDTHHPGRRTGCHVGDPAVRPGLDVAAGAARPYHSRGCPARLVPDRRRVFTCQNGAFRAGAGCAATVVDISPRNAAALAPAISPSPGPTGAGGDRDGRDGRGGGQADQRPAWRVTTPALERAPARAGCAGGAARRRSSTTSVRACSRRCSEGRAAVGVWCSSGLLEGGEGHGGGGWARAVARCRCRCRCRRGAAEPHPAVPGRRPSTAAASAGVRSSTATSSSSRRSPSGSSAIEAARARTARPHRAAPPAAPGPRRPRSGDPGGGPARRGTAGAASFVGRHVRGHGVQPGDGPPAAGVEPVRGLDDLEEHGRDHVGDVLGRAEPAQPDGPHPRQVTR
jgi:hypothetical protein